MHYLAHLKKDKKLARIIKGPTESLKLKKNVSLRLMASIMSQQLSTKVAAVLQKRFLDLFNGKTPTNKMVADLPFEIIRGIGLSNAKTTYIQNVAKFFIEHQLTDKKLHALSNEQAMDLLIQIKGVGKWTVEMLLMFSLGREDLFALDDLGLQNAMIGIYKLDSSDKKAFRAEILRLSNKWSPYRTYACLYLWQWKDGQ